MAITVDVQNDKFPYLARQICGDIATAFGYGIDHVYEKDLEFIDFLSKFSIDNLYGTWLDKLGLILGLPRPFVSNPFGNKSFQFDNTDKMLDGDLHGFSTTIPVTINGVTYDRSNGGMLDSIYRITDESPISDVLYKKYLHATTLLKKTHSLKNLADVLELFIDSTRFAITFISTAGYVNDIQVILSATTAEYMESLQIALNKIFTTPPFALVTVSLDFDNIYTIPVINDIIAEITGETTGYTVVYSIVGSKAVFTITLDSSLSEYEDAVRTAVEAHFAGANDVVIIVEVQ